MSADKKITCKILILNKVKNNKIENNEKNMMKEGKCELNRLKTIYTKNNLEFANDNITSKAIGLPESEILHFNNVVNTLSQDEMRDFYCLVAYADVTRLHNNIQPFTLDETVWLVEAFKKGFPIVGSMESDALCFAKNYDELKERFNNYFKIEQEYGTYIHFNGDNGIIDSVYKHKFNLSLGGTLQHPNRNITIAMEHFAEKCKNPYFPDEMTFDGVRLYETLSRMSPDKQKEAVVLIQMLDNTMTKLNKEQTTAIQADTLLFNFSVKEKPIIYPDDMTTREDVKNIYIKYQDGSRFIKRW